jgi:membrane protease YdiL (CAAX protease family)
VLSPGPSRRFALIAVVTAYALIEIALWTRGRTQLVWSLIAATWIIWTIVHQRRPPRDLGIGGRGFAASAWVIPASLAVCGAMMFTAWKLGTLHDLYGPNPVLYHSAGYLIWALEQEFILQSFFYLNLEELAGNRLRSAMIATVLFASAHIPNPVLVAATLAAGICFTQLFRRYRNIYALGIAHGLLGLTLALSVPNDVHHHMRVGIGYLRYHPNPSAAAPPFLGLPQR